MFGIVASISDNGMAVSRAPGAPPAGSRCRWGGRAGTLLPLAWPLIQELIPAASGVAGSTGRRVPITQPRAARPVCACAVGPAPSVSRSSPEGGGRRAELTGLDPNLGQQSILGLCSSLDTECLCICYECFSSKDKDPSFQTPGCLMWRVESQPQVLAEEAWLIISSTAYYAIIFTDIMDNSYSTGYSTSFTNRWTVILVLNLRVDGARMLSKIFQQLSIICTATAHCTLHSAQNNPFINLSILWYQTPHSTGRPVRGGRADAAGQRRQPAAGCSAAGVTGLSLQN